MAENPIPIPKTEKNPSLEMLKNNKVSKYLIKNKPPLLTCVPTEESQKIMSIQEIHPADTEKSSNLKKLDISRDDVFTPRFLQIGSAPVIPTSSQYGLAFMVNNLIINGKEYHLSLTDSGVNISNNSKNVHFNEPFKVVKIESTQCERGRWTCLDYIESSVIQAKQQENSDYNFNYAAPNTNVDRVTKYRDYYNKSLNQLNSKKKLEDVCTTDMAQHLNLNCNLKQKFCLSYNEVLKSVNNFEQKLYKKTKIEANTKAQQYVVTSKPETPIPDPTIMETASENVPANKNENITAFVNEFMNIIIKSPPPAKQEASNYSDNATAIRTDDNANNNSSSSDSSQVTIPGNQTHPNTNQNNNNTAAIVNPPQTDPPNEAQSPVYY